ncbi:hypothetical protein Vafri_15857 [Volvox africanus]|uniref:PIH1 N-terminal domain-containing protein n=1 Tax=Volvox africanus TaxID=51714 RepID=A0A8J4F5T6_9CHLO|nr:hypothetical protein Vafri_15857 [Volvox africanus]
MIPQTKPGQPTDEEQAPSPEELLAMVEFLQQQGLNMDQVPSDLKTMLDNVKRQKAAKGGGPPPPPDALTEEIAPAPGFVIKTSEVASGKKVFINVCSSDRVPAPGGWSNGMMPDEVAAALDKLQSGENGAAAMTPGEVEALRFPLSCGAPRLDNDRKGALCTVVDVVFNSDVVRAAAAARKLKAMLIEVATGWVANKISVELDPRYKLPKMRYKGEVVASQRIRAEEKKKQLVTELRDVDEEPSFALRTTKAPPPPPPPPQQQKQLQGTQSQLQPQSREGATAASSVVGKAGSRSEADSGPGSTPGMAKSDGLGAAAAAAKGPGSGAAATTGGTGGALTYKVEYEGRPVQWIQVTVDLPPPLLLAADQTQQQQQPIDVVIEVCGRTLYVRRPGHPELQVPLLFAASTEGASATGGQDRQLIVRLPYRSLDEYLADARAQAPLAFGQLNFASKALLELEP